MEPKKVGPPDHMAGLGAALSPSVGTPIGAGPSGGTIHTGAPASPPVGTPVGPGPSGGISDPVTTPVGGGLHIAAPGPPIEVAATLSQPAVSASSSLAFQPAMVASHGNNGIGLLIHSDGVGIEANGREFAGLFMGNVIVTGNTRLASVELTGSITSDVQIAGNLAVGGDIRLSGADYAEDFNIVDLNGAEPGTVMVLDDFGGIRMSDTAYDRRVAGVISGAGGYRPAVILDGQTPRTDRRPLALMGKVYCMADASDAPIAIGDLLTSSSTPGHAMKAADPTLAFGAVIGKALQPLASGRGLVPILVTLQ